MTTTAIKPSDLKNWNDIDKSKVREDDKSFHPEYYGWYAYTPTGFKSDGIYLPHRKPTVNELYEDRFI